MSAARASPRRRTLWSAFGVSVMVLAIAWPILNSNREAPIPQELEIGRRTALGIASGMVHDYVGRNGRYPDRLGDAMRDELGVRYQRIDEGFELSTTMPDGTTLTVKQR